MNNPVVVGLLIAVLLIVLILLLTGGVNVSR